MGARQLIEKRVPQESKCVAAGCEASEKRRFAVFSGFLGLRVAIRRGFYPLHPDKPFEKGLSENFKF